MAKKYVENPLRIIIKLGTKSFVEAKERVDDEIRDLFLEAEENFLLKENNEIRPFRVILKRGTKTLKGFAQTRDDGPMDVIGKALEWIQEQ